MKLIKIKEIENKLEIKKRKLQNKLETALLWDI